MPDYLRALYGTFPLDLDKFNGEPSWTLPIPAGRIIEAIDYAVPVGVVAFGPESISGMYRLFRE